MPCDQHHGFLLIPSLGRCKDGGPLTRDARSLNLSASWCFRSNMRLLHNWRCWTYEPNVSSREHESTMAGQTQ
uniref:Uncharacterized protein n=1 Tax=Arundo donax TaxID=35708 RepID=A0A0A9CFS0_ARUDO